MVRPKEHCSIGFSVCKTDAIRKPYPAVIDIIIIEFITLQNMVYVPNDRTQNFA